MASSSRSKKPGIKNPLDLSRLLQNETQRTRFIHRYLERPVMTPKYGSLSAFEDVGCTFPELIRVQALHVFVENKAYFYPELIRVFYCNLEIKDGVLHSWVKGKAIILNLQEFAMCLNLPSVGAELGPLLQCPWKDFNKMDFYFSLCRFSEAEIRRKRQRTASSSQRETLGVGNMTVEYRLLHYFLVYIIYQKSSNYAQVAEFDLELLYGLVHKDSINWAFLIMYHMSSQTSKTGALPYAFAITRILKHFNVDLSNEIKVGVTVKDNQIDLTSLGRMQIRVSADGILRWTDEEEPVVQENVADDQAVGDQVVGDASSLNMIMAEIRSMRQAMNSGFESLNSRLLTGLESIDYRFDQMALQHEEIIQDMQALSVRLDLMDASDSHDGGAGA